MTQNLGELRNQIAALTGNPETPMSFRMFHDQRGDVAGRTRHGTANELFAELCAANTNEGFGIFLTVNETNLQGAKLEDMVAIRANWIDLDGVDAGQQLINATTAATMQIRPSYMVNSSPGKCHVYWPVARHQDFNLWERVQRRLITKFNSDPTMVDTTRVMRAAGFYHLKGTPHLVTGQAIDGGAQTSTDALEITLYNFEPYQSAGGGGAGSRIPMGQGDHAPDLATAVETLRMIDVNDLTERNEWTAVFAAVMQSVPFEQLADLKPYVIEWGASYVSPEGKPNDPGAVEKLWHDLTQHGTSVRGWGKLYKTAHGHTLQEAKQWAAASATPIVGTALLDAAQAVAAPIAAPLAISAAPVAPSVDPATGFGTLLDPFEQSQFFAGCVMITTEGCILCADNVFRGPGDFNMEFGGKEFIINDSAKPVAEPWKAVIQNQKYRMPQVQFTSFRPQEPQRSITKDMLGRSYVNTYLPAIIDHREGDVTPFLNHLTALFPNENDRNHLIAYMAHNIKFPGHKLFWAPLVQGAEGMGKNLIKRTMEHAMGEGYFYQPAARDLAEGGAKFNGWMEKKLFFLVDEIKTDDRGDITEVLKPFITETKLEIQGKGKDQKMGDTPGNWMFFSNHKDAIPITLNTRRHAMFFSVMQDRDDLIAAGLTDAYFTGLYNWLDHQGGVQFVTHWLLNHPIEQGALPLRAPHTSSTQEACSAGRGTVANVIAEAISNDLAGFRNGWVSTAAIARVFRESDMKTVPVGNTIAKAMRELDYHKIGQGKAYMTDDPLHPEKRPVLWNVAKNADVSQYGAAQGDNYM